MTPAEAANQNSGDIGLSVSPELPHDPLSDRFQDYFQSKYQSALSAADAQWLGALVADFLHGQSDLLISENQKRAAAEKMLAVLLEVDRQMAAAPNPQRRWLEISCALGLPSACFGRITEAAIARQCISRRADTFGRPLTKMAISRSIARLRTFFDVPPAFNQHGDLRNLQH